MTDFLPTQSPHHRPDATAQRQLLGLADEHMMRPARAAGYELRLLGATVLPQQQTICRTQHGTWLLVDNRNDPSTLDYDGKIPVPAAEHERLHALARAGVQIDHVWLAHELPPEWREGDVLPRLVPPPPDVRRGDERVEKTIENLTTWPAAVAGGVAAVGLDPIVLGGVQHLEQPFVIWAVLALWDWE